jgi:hypothetical protein
MQTSNQIECRGSALVEMIKTWAHESAHTLAYMALYENVSRLWIDYTVPKASVRAPSQSVMNPFCGSDLEAVALVAGIVGESICFTEPLNPIDHWKAVGPSAGDYADYQKIAGLCRMSLSEHMAIAVALLDEFGETWDWIESISEDDDHPELLMEERCNLCNEFFAFRQRHFKHLGPDLTSGESLPEARGKVKAKRSGAGKPKSKTDVPAIDGNADPTEDDRDPKTPSP